VKVGVTHPRSQGTNPPTRGTRKLTGTCFGRVLRHTVNP
jgi:hypothetical protein